MLDGGDKKSSPTIEYLYRSTENKFPFPLICQMLGSLFQNRSSIKWIHLKWSPLVQPLLSLKPFTFLVLFTWGIASFSFSFFFFSISLLSKFLVPFLSPFNRLVFLIFTSRLYLKARRSVLHEFKDLDLVSMTQRSDALYYYLGVREMWGRDEDVRKSESKRYMHSIDKSQHARWAENLNERSGSDRVWR